MARMSETPPNSVPVVAGVHAAGSLPGPVAVRSGVWRERLRAINPLDLLFSPVFARDASIVARQRSTYWVRAGYALVMLFFVGLTFWGISVGAMQLAGAARLQAFQRMAPGVALAMAWVQFLGLGFLAPNVAASALTDERRNRTLATLASTPLSSAEIVFGLFASRWIQLVLVALLAAPLLLGLRAFGGLEVEYVVATSAISLSTAALGVALTLLGSTFATKASGAAGFAIGTLVGLSVLPGMTFLLWNYLSGQGTNAAQQAIGTFLSPPIAMAAAATSGVRVARLPLGLSFTEFWLAASAGYMTMAVGVCVGTSAILRRVMLRVAAHEATPASGLVPRRRKGTAVPGVTTMPANAASGGDASQAKSKKSVTATAERLSRTVSDQPVLWREVRQRAFKNPAISLVGFIVAAIAVVVLYAINPGSLRAVTLGINGVAIFIFVIQAFGAATGAVTEEVQGRTWSVLLTTTLRPRDILLGKAIGAARRLALIPSMVLTLLVILTVCGYFNPIGIVHVALVYAGVMALLCPTGAVLSLMSRKTTAATSLNLLLGATLWLGLPIVVAIPFGTGAVGPKWAWLGDILIRAAMVINPLQLATEAVDGAYATAGIANFSYQLGSGQPAAGAWMFTLYVVVFAGLCAGAGALTLLLGEWLFPKYAARRI